MKKRINNFSKAVRKKCFDGFLIRDAANIRYLTGISQAEGWLLFTANKELLFFTNPIQAKAIKGLGNLKLITAQKNLIAKIANQARKIKLKKIGFLPTISLGNYQKLKEKLAEKKINFIPAAGLIEKFRMQKDKHEINSIKKAAAVSLKAFDYIKEIFSQTMTEKDLSIEAERFLKLKADNKIAFPPIVASGKNTLFAHHQPNKTRLGNFFLIDLGAMHCGYCADLTRIFFWGKMPLLFKRVYDTIKKAQSAAIKKIKDGRKASEIDKVARDIIEAQGFGKYFVHGLGHGIGLDVHEPPYLNRGREEILKEGMVVTIEPGIYYKNLFGVRLEDIAVVKSKNAEVIS